MSGRKSSHEAEVGRHGISYCIESEASMDGTGSIGATGVGGVISSEEESAATGGMRSSGNGRSPKDTSKKHMDQMT